MHGLSATLLLLTGLTALTTADKPLGQQNTGGRWKRESLVNTESSNTTTDDGLPPDDPPLGPSLGEILGLVALVITILYIIGISWKVMKIYKGEYVPTEPVYLKYK